MYIIYIYILLLLLLVVDPHPYLLAAKHATWNRLLMVSCLSRFKLMWDVGMMSVLLLLLFLTPFSLAFFTEEVIYIYILYIYIYK